MNDVRGYEYESFLCFAGIIGRVLGSTLALIDSRGSFLKAPTEGFCDKPTLSQMVIHIFVPSRLQHN